MDPNTDNVGFTSSHSSSVGVKKKGSKLWVVIVIVLLLALGGYILYSNSRKSQEKPKEAVVPTEAPTEAPTVTASPSGALTPSPSPKPTTGVVSSAADLNIQVLNGSGTVGAASQVKDFLASKGYKHLETGNADNFDYQKITVKIKDSQKKFLSTVQKDLQEKYELATGSGTLSADSLFDVSVIVGK